MRTLYRSTFEKGKGFTGKEWWGAVSSAAGGVSFDDFQRRYIDGREPFPYAADFGLAGLAAVEDSNRIARIGIQTSNDSGAPVVQVVTPGSAFATAGGLQGDALVRVGGFNASESTWAAQFRTRYGNSPEGTLIPVVVRRDGRDVALQMPLQFVTIISHRLTVDANASPAAVKVRHGIMTGSVSE
jgi:predicted metalloprotease with PDZ domain